MQFVTELPAKLQADPAIAAAAIASLQVQLPLLGQLWRAATPKVAVMLFKIIPKDG